MSASTHSSATDVDGGESESAKIEALFLIRFDKKVGYTISWKRTTTPDISLENGVEFKSLPSGLHSLQSDLVYFTHDGYAGLSAFARGDAGAEERNANFVSVGVLARRDGQYGRLGRAWLIAGRLEKLAAALADDAEAVTPLEEFWEEQTSHTKSHGEASDEDSKEHSRARAISTVSAVTKDDERLPAYHPALSILRYIDVFGPLVFRLQQAALLRKRILFVGTPPVRLMCDFVYILSILSSLSARDADLLFPGTESLLRLPTLFSVGVHDIPSLERTGTDGWVACTTDEIIATKNKLYDIIVELPHSPNQKISIRTSDKAQIKASQRDVARFKLLHRALFTLRNASVETYSDTPDSSEHEPLISHDEISAQRAEDEYNESYDDTIVEPSTWSRLAYAGFMWWASAGERDAYATSERDAEREIMGDLASHSNVELAVIAYFHRLSGQFVGGLGQIVQRDDEGDEDGDDGEDEGVVLDRAELSGLGLDRWSEADAAFVQEFGAVWFGRQVEVGGGGVDCCGLRVPLL
ncbi:hypothetical protein CC86DRAFT_348358 [Ophiobolus disseminans]|uniref:DUF4484 domain-containing protein n=1 Tax=Ophiobolus disseminans TaxID=1469910 RepID=A0A6A7A6N9_9PLEO|nr:hypothetical protein CC86DRAFT_348358 [Ophiobolus disseminans]